MMIQSLCITILFVFITTLTLLTSSTSNVESTHNEKLSSVSCQIVSDTKLKTKQTLHLTLPIRTCKVSIVGKQCPNPVTCPGRNWNVNCILRTGGNSNLKQRRRILVQTKRTCAVCKRIDPLCPGIRNRSKCNFKN